MSENQTIEHAKEIAAKKPTIVERMVDGVANFEQQHPKIVKGLKVTANIVGGVVTFGLGVLAGKKITEHRASMAIDDDYVIDDYSTNDADDSEDNMSEE